MDRFDDLARATAMPHSRRTILKGIVTAAAAATAATVLRPFRSEASTCPAGAAACGSGCCQAKETCSDPATGCCCPAGSTPCGTACCTGGVACADRKASICSCPAGMTPCGRGAGLTCCAKGTACGDASCQPVSSFSSNVAKTCNPCGTGTVLFTDDFNSDFQRDCATSLNNWNIEANGNVDVTTWPGSSGNVLDLDGSTNLCPSFTNGTPEISLKVPITVVAGRTYTACFRISTNPSQFLPLGGAFDPSKVDVNSMTVHFGPVTNQYTKQPSDKTSFTTESLSFVAAANGTAQLTFKEDGLWDRGGILLDTVTITETV